MSALGEIAVRTPDAKRMGFFTDTTVCIGCKACEVACKQWNDLPADGSQFKKGGSYDHTGTLSASTWRHVRFVETVTPSAARQEEAAAALARGKGGHLPNIPAAGGGAPPEGDLNLVAAAEGSVEGLDRWVFMSDVCKHCTNAGCLDACPTGALIRTEFETVIVQADICNGCGYCIPSCPFGVIDRDPACAKACPTDSIQFGPHDELVELAKGRVAALHEKGLDSAYLYGAGDSGEEQLAGGLGAFFLLTEPPERFGLPAQADSPIQENMPAATAAGMTAAAIAAVGTVATLVISHRRGKR
jgi:formate dehydrogenase iron-sulfur subunit